jgi:4-hydroxy-tetrahydrodipicolinate reductase
MRFVVRRVGATMKTVIGIHGVCGRTGRRIVDLAHADPEITLAAALDTADHPLQGRDVGEIAGVGPLGLKVASELPLHTRLDVMLDFSTPAGTMSILPTCLDRKIPLVIATTGHSPEQRTEIGSAAHFIAILHAPNTSLGVNVLVQLVREAAELLRGRDYDIEILERHHRFKKDAPSGTALHLAKVVEQATGVMRLRHGREGQPGARTAQEIGIHAVRVGDNVGEHTVIFSTLGETLELTHRAHARDCYAKGALQAAKFMANRPAGSYSMEDVLEMRV